jgi:hypothetical protein
MTRITRLTPTLHTVLEHDLPKRGQNNVPVQMFNTYTEHDLPTPPSVIPSGDNPTSKFLFMDSLRS